MNEGSRDNLSSNAVPLHLGTMLSPKAVARQQGSILPREIPRFNKVIVAIVGVLEHFGGNQGRSPYAPFALRKHSV